jgi:hypothetical protein
MANASTGALNLGLTEGTHSGDMFLGSVTQLIINKVAAVKPNAIEFLLLVFLIRYYYSFNLDMQSAFNKTKRM